MSCKLLDYQEDLDESIRFGQQEHDSIVIKEHRPESRSWQTALDSLDEARKAFARLAR